jgi:hypothetical protein
MKTKIYHLIPANMPLGEYFFVYSTIAKEHLDNASIKLFASKTDKELISLSAKMAGALVLRPIQLKRNRPIIPVTTGPYTPFARRMQAAAIVVAAPMLALAMYEITRRNSETPLEKYEREETLLRSRLSE